MTTACSPVASEGPTGDGPPANVLPPHSRLLSCFSVFEKNIAPPPANQLNLLNEPTYTGLTACPDMAGLLSSSTD